MLVRRPVLREHVLPLIGLTVRADQAGLVSSNARTLAQAAYEPGAHVWGLWEDAVPVGLMAMINPAMEHDGDDPLRQQPDDPSAAYLWRLMIGADHQGKGYGGAALAEAFSQTRAWGYARLMAHVADEPHSNLGFYEHFGFRNTGLVEGDEFVIMATIR